MLGEGFARPTVTLILTTLRALLTAAVDDNIIKHNPCLKLGRRPRSSTHHREASSTPKTSRSRRSPPSSSRSFLMPRKQLPIPYGPLFWLLALTGVRVGEGLAVRAVRLRPGQAHAPRPAHAQWWIPQTRPKSGRARPVSLSERAATILHRLQLNRVDRAKRLKRKTIPEYVFTTRLGEPPSGHAIRVAFAQVLELEAGLPKHHTPHSLRHSYATLLLRNGETLMFVKKEMETRDNRGLTADHRTANIG